MTAVDAASDIAVTVVDTDVHPMPVSAEVLKTYAPPQWRDTPVADGQRRHPGSALDLGDNLMFSTDYPHWSYDSPEWAVRRFPADQRERIMRGNATELYSLPATVKAL